MDFAFDKTKEFKGCQKIIFYNKSYLCIRRI